MKKIFFLLLPLLLYAKSATLLRVVDGDTLLLKDKDGFVICQLSFIDTPELLQNEKFAKDLKNCLQIEKEESLQAGEEAQDFAKSLLKDVKKIEYKITRILPNQNPVCQVSLPKGLDANINPTLSEIMVQQGYALPYIIYANEEQKQKFLELGFSAKKEQRGLWKSYPKLMRCLVQKRYSLRSLRD
jgi:endonuclease YncB( thermonuclease family)